MLLRLLSIIITFNFSHAFYHVNAQRSAHTAILILDT